MPRVCFICFKEVKMEFPAELVRGEIVKCYKNLILDVQIGDEVVPVFCPELDARQKIYVPGAEVWLLPTGNPRRRLKYETQMINRDGSLIMINPTYAEVLLEEAFSAGLLTDFSAYNRLRRVDESDDVSYAQLEFSNEREEKCYVYAVSIYNKQGACVVFPSFINFFEMEMFSEFAKLREMGHETRVVLIVPREDCADIKFVWNIAPMAAAKIFDEAKNGLKFCGYVCTISDKSIKITRKMKILY